MTRRSGTDTGGRAGTAGVVGTNGPPKPLGRARTRLEKIQRRAKERLTTENGKKHKFKGRTRDSAVIQAQYVAIRSEGVPVSRAAAALGIGQDAARTLEKLPETQLEILKRRELLKSLTISELGKTLRPAWEMAQRTVVEHDPKGFDATMRGLHAAEKIAQGVTGETLKVEHSGIPSTQVTVAVADEIKLLVAQLRGNA